MGRLRLPEHLKKKSSDYPQLAFRLRAEDKRKLLRLAEDVAKAINRSKEKGAAAFTKGDAFVQALYIGLEQLRKGPN